MGKTTMPSRDRVLWGTFAHAPEIYGRSHLGIPLEVWLPERSSPDLLIFAGVHGEEGDTVFVLSRALRSLKGPLRSAAVILAANPDGLVRGTRGNARGVDLNRNFPSSDWQPDPVTHRAILEAPSDIQLSPGDVPASEPETLALIRLLDALKPKTVIALHSPLGCIDDPDTTALGMWLAEQTGLEQVSGVGYKTPGSFGTWGRTSGLEVITYELPRQAGELLVRDHAPVLARLMAGDWEEGSLASAAL